MSRMLVIDPKQRATMQEVMNHPWMIKGFSGPPDNYLPPREPLTQPLDPEVIHAMQGFNFGSPESIKAQLVKIIESDEYQQAVKLYQREKDYPAPTKDGDKKRGFGFDFYKRRNSGHSRDTLTGASSETLQLGHDPMYAFSPLLSIYYLVREKQEREPAPAAPPPTRSASSRDPEKTRERTRERDEPNRDRERDRDREREAHAMPALAAPQAAHTNSGAFEMPGEKPTGGRARPRARTHGEDDAPETTRQNRHAPAQSTSAQVETKADQLQKKEGGAAGLLRRFSTRKRREPDRPERDRSHPPVVQVHSPAEQQSGAAPLTPSSSATPITPKKSFSIRRGRRDREDDSATNIRSGSSQPGHSELLSPPLSAGGTRGSRKTGGLGRSTSVNSGDMRRRETTRLTRGAHAATSGSEQSVSNGQGDQGQINQGHSRSVSMRTKSLGHARRESIQRRRLKREGLEGPQEADVPEETDMELEQSGVSTERLDSAELAKPVYLKGLFSVSTTSGKSVPAIRADIKRVLKQLNVDFTEIKGGFSCRHTPSIDLNKVQDLPATPGQTPGQTPGHRRRFSFGGLKRNDDRDEIREMDRDRQPTSPRTPGRGDRDRDRSDREKSDREKSDRDRSYSNSETSVDSIPRRRGGARRAPGETSTQVQSDLGESMVLEFEIFIVKVPLLTLHGVQFKRITGNTWQFKNMADQILRDLRL